MDEATPTINAAFEIINRDADSSLPNDFVLILSMSESTNDLTLSNDALDDVKTSSATSPMIRSLNGELVRESTSEQSRLESQPLG